MDECIANKTLKKYPSFLSISPKIHEFMNLLEKKTLLKYNENISIL